MRNGYRRRGKARMLGAVTLLGVCLVLGVRYGIRHGWLVGHTHWVTRRHKLSEYLRDRPYL